MIANRHSQAALLKSQIDQLDHRLKELEKSASSLRVTMVRLKERMEEALPPPPPPPPPPPLLVPKEGYMVRWNKPPNDASPEAERKREYMRNYMRGRRQRLPEAVA
jgi:hypothetical protein